MKTKTRILSLLMAVCMTAAIIPITAQAFYDWTPAPPPTYIEGYEDGTVRPDAPVTRAEAAVMLWRLLWYTVYVPGNAYYFSDIPGGTWDADAVNHMGAIGIFTGYEDGTFRPYMHITREEFAVIVCRLFRADAQHDLATPPFSDLVNSWASAYIAAVVAQGWMTGYEDDTFRQNEDISRAEVVTVLNRALGRPVETMHIPEECYTLYSDLPVTHWAFRDIIVGSVEIW